MPKVDIEKKITPFKTISQVADIIGVETYVLRFWEKEFIQIKPQRTSGRRYYDQENIDMILKIKSMLYEQKLTIEGAKKQLRNKDLHNCSTDTSSQLLSKLKDIESLLC